MKNYRIYIGNLGLEDWVSIREDGKPIEDFHSYSEVIEEVLPDWYKSPIPSNFLEVTETQFDQIKQKTDALIDFYVAEIERIKGGKFTCWGGDEKYSYSYNSSLVDQYKLAVELERALAALHADVAAKKEQAKRTGEIVTLGAGMGPDGNLVIYYTNPDGSEFVYHDKD